MNIEASIYSHRLVKPSHYMSHIEIDSINHFNSSIQKENNKREGFNELKKILFQNMSPDSPGSFQMSNSLKKSNDESIELK